MTGEDRYLSVMEVAELLGFSDTTIHTWIHANKLPAVKIQRSYRIRQSDVDRLVRAHDTAATVGDGPSIWEDPSAQEFRRPGVSGRG
jgi:excisionase family DNA binding protein